MNSIESPSLSGTGLEGSVWQSEGGVQPQPVRLLKMVTLFACGGTEGQVMNLTRGLDRSQFDLRFACLKKWGHFLEEIEQQDIPVSEFQINSFYNPCTFFQQMRFAAYMRSHRLQIMHSYNFYANVFAIPAARLAGVPVIIASIRDRGIYLSQAQKRVQKWVCSFADRILVNAESIKDWLIEEGYKADRISIIKNGIDLSLYKTKISNCAVRKQLGVPESAPLVMMFSRLNPQKGVDDFLKAAALVARSHPNVYFLIVGDKQHYKDGAFETDMDYHQELKQLAEQLGISGNIVFTGHRSDIPDLLSEASISVLPSLSEGLSNTLLESMAAGVPVVATRVGGNPELVEDDVCGILVPPQSPVKLSEAITRILNDSDLARRFSCESKRKATNEFSLDRMVRDTQSLYLSQLREKYQVNK